MRTILFVAYFDMVLSVTDLQLVDLGMVEENRMEELNKGSSYTIHWGLASSYRQEIMGIACIMIMGCHCTFQWPDSFLMKIVKTAVQNSGNVGVEIFLLVSGIGLCFAYEKCTDLKQFYLHRYVRLLVPYLILCVPYWVWRDLYVGKDNFFMDVFQLTFPLKGIITYWYITASAGFYLVFPLVYNWINGKYRLLQGGTREMRTTILCFLSCIVLLVLMYRHPTLYRNCEIGLTRFVVFVIGCYLGNHVKEEKMIPAHWILLSGIITISVPLLFQMVSMHDYWYRVFYWFFGWALLVVLMWVLHFDWMGKLRKAFRFCGERSIELYITHVSIRNVFETYDPQGWLDRDRVSGYLVVLAISFVVTILIHPVISGISHWMINKGTNRE